MYPKGSALSCELNDAWCGGCCSLLVNIVLLARCLIFGAVWMHRLAGVGLHICLAFLGVGMKREGLSFPVWGRTPFVYSRRGCV